ncbi:ABC transporter ATP-binding protein [Aquibaculum arenosum]|uniref:ABC transporter ATP-binding protein n=1 Tax=Aquibaculum arenosum TaxID=3032591 RepID=A0ABT5YJH2_9PROT|nr:ABC transporter ATP-binding protein [Fodinicurvata sp. CAU 1616]MDF2095085.1 ABC transporter ATP-binding protein [Fodinicurvata sp. CAU 1616]
MRFNSRDFSNNKVVLDVRDLSVRLPNQPQVAPILNQVSLQIRAGETACLVGESGSGKSVTSLAVMGLLPKDALRVTGGGITLSGRNLLELTQKEMRAARARNMAMIFQEPMTALNPVMRVGDQIEEVLKVHGDLPQKARQERVLAIMEQVHLPDVRRVYASYPHQLSGGQRQRIMIAMALILEPELLIADEPTTALDVTTQGQILKLIAELQEKQDTAVLFITHDMGVVAEIADSVHVMKDGQVVEQAPVEQLLRQPREDYTRKLLKAVPSLIPRQERPETLSEPESQGEKVLQVQKLRKVYGGRGFFRRGEGTLAAEDVSFAITRGRTLGIVGESGSGKSTVARCVMRLIEPTDGQIVVAGSEIAQLSRQALRPHRRHIQIVFQDPFRSLNPRWKVGRSLVEGPVNYGASRQEAMQQAGDLMELVGLPREALGRYPHQFSGGQRQRIAIARAVAMKPDVLVADEAVSALDVSIQAQVLELLADIQEKLGVAILFITHDLRVAAQICDDILVMQNGKIVEYGPAGDVLANPRDAYTRALTDAAPGRGWDFANFRELQSA